MVGAEVVGAEVVGGSHVVTACRNWNKDTVAVTQYTRVADINYHAQKSLQTESLQQPPVTIILMWAQSALPQHIKTKSMHCLETIFVPSKNYKK